VEHNQRFWHVTRWKYSLTWLHSSTYAFCTHRGAVRRYISFRRFNCGVMQLQRNPTYMRLLFLALRDITRRWLIDSYRANWESAERKLADSWRWDLTVAKLWLIHKSVTERNMHCDSSTKQEIPEHDSETWAIPLG